MYFEQAFQCLPEVLVGSHYPTQDYESGVVVAFTLALLQELNGRNIQDPISLLQGECLYAIGGFACGDTRRNLRADLKLKLDRLRVANRRLERYGWRHFNWLEAKFFREPKRDAGKHSGNKTKYTAQLLLDLIRLTVLVAEKPGTKSRNGRYLLHVYDDLPKFYTVGSADWTKKWAPQLHKPGSQKIVVDALAGAAAGVQGTLGQGFPVGINLTANITNYLQFPLRLAQAGQEPKGKSYWCVLTRLDEFVVSIGNQKFSVKADRSVAEEADGDFEAMRTTVACSVGIKGAKDTAPVDSTDDEEPDDPGDGDPQANGDAQEGAPADQGAPADGDAQGGAPADQGPPADGDVQGGTAAGFAPPSGGAGSADSGAET